MRCWKGARPRAHRPTACRWEAGRLAAAIAGFDYSEAMQDKGAVGLAGDAGTLDR